MRARLGMIAGIFTLTLVACDGATAPVARDLTPAFQPTLLANAQPEQAGPSNRCYGAITAGIAATWPWAHAGQVDFAPPPGSIALWIELFGPVAGVSSVRDLQLLFCGGL
jgi:hypothetical protein